MLRSKCNTAGTGPIKERLLVFGESWAAGGKELPALPIGFAVRHNTPVRVCTVGYSGSNTGKLIIALHRDWTRQRLEELLGGKPTRVIFLTGVNDVVQHRGATAYYNDMRQLTQEQIWSGARLSTVEIPNINTSPSNGILSWGKSFLQRWINDGGNYNPIPHYRARLAESNIQLQIIPYVPFSRGYKIEPKRYTPDGIHLTQHDFQLYGAYIAGELK